MGRPGIGLHWTWTFALTPITSNRTRFHFRSRIAVRPFWLRLGYRAALVPADFVMARSMCHGLKQRVERLHGCAHRDELD
jgi:hypothetical protein